MLASKPKRLLSLLLVLVMLLGLVPTGVFAQEPTDLDIQAEKQIVDGGGTLYYDKDGKPADASDYAVKLTKTVNPTGTENRFTINLEVETRQNIQELEAAPDAAVVLVFDASGTMNSSVEGDQKRHVDYAKEAAQAFLETYVEDAGDAQRKVAVVEFGTNAKTVLNWTEANAGGNTVAQAAQHGVDQVEPGFEHYMCYEEGPHTCQTSGNGTNPGDDFASVVIQIDQNAYGWNWVNYAQGIGTCKICGYESTNLATTSHYHCLVCGQRVVGLRPGQHDHTIEANGPHTLNYDAGSTNIEAGLLLARNLLLAGQEDDTLAGINNLYVILLSDGSTNTYTAEEYRNINETTFVASKGGDLSQEPDEEIPLRNVAADIQNRDGASNPVSGGAKLYSVGYNVSHAIMGYVSPGYSGALKVSEWFSDVLEVDRYYAAENSDELVLAFKGIAQFIKTMANAWIVTDPMPDGGYVTYASDNTFASQKYARWDEQNNQVVWDLKQMTPTGGNGETTFTYDLSYDVILHPEAAGFAEETPYPTNGQAKLSYLMLEEGKNLDDMTPEEITALLKTVNFETPEVKGYLGAFNFMKYARHQDAAGGDIPLSGAQFNLSNQADDNLGADAGKINREATSGSGQDGDAEKGQVEFTSIPSGYTYTLSENGEFTSDGKTYAPTEEEWSVTVSYGVPSGGPEDGVVRNTIKQQPLELTLTKTWQAPTTTTITVDVYRQDVGTEGDGEMIATLTLNGSTCSSSDPDAVQVTSATSEAKQWVYTLTVDKYNQATGGEYTYTVKELPLEGYESKVDGLSITNTATGTTSVSVEKQWLPIDGQPMTGMPAVEVTLIGNTATDPNKTLGTATLSEGSLFHTWTNVPVYDAYGNPYTYTVSEKAGDYQQVGAVTGTGTEGDPFVITNTVLEGTVEIPVTKTWKDGGAADRPDVTVELLQDGQPFGHTYVLTSADADPDDANVWTHTFTGLPQYQVEGNQVHEYKYTVKELGADELEGYTSTQNGDRNIINTRTETVAITVEKVWDDGENSFTHGEVTIDLYRNGQELESKETTGNVAVFEGLARYDENGVEYSYTVVEPSVPANYTVSYDYGAGNNKVVFESGAGTATVTNTLNEKDDTVSLTVNKVWQHPAGTTAPDVTFTVIQKDEDGVEVDPDFKSYTMEAGTTTYTFTDLPKYYYVDIPEVKNPETGDVISPASVAERKYQYEVEEGKVNGYNSSAPDVEGDTWTFTNTITGTVELSVEKKWVSTESSYPTATITLQRRANGGAWETVGTWATTDNASHDWGQLDKYDDAGQLYTYKVVEASVPGYSTAYAPANATYGEGTNKVTVTNTQSQDQTGSLVATKTWNDNGNAEGLRTDITLHLWQKYNGGNDADLGTVVISADGTNAGTGTYQGQVLVEKTTNDKWTITFSQLEKIANVEGQVYRYEYYVTEDAVLNYTTSISDGKDITNTLAQGTTQVQLTKTWIDPQGTNHPSVTFTLTAETTDGKPVNSVTNPSWTFPQTVTLGFADGNTKPQNQSGAELTADGSVWYYTWTDLPTHTDDQEQIVYKVSEGAVDGYTSVSGLGNTFTNTIEQEMLNFTGTKTWDMSALESDDYLKPTAQPVWIALYYVNADGQLGQMVDGCLTQVQPVDNGDGTITASFAFNDLPRYDLSSGAELKYTVREVAETTGQDGQKGYSAIENDGTITFQVSDAGQTYNYNYTVSYDEQPTGDDNYTGSNTQVTNTYGDPQYYFYKILANYTTKFSDNGQTIYTAAGVNVTPDNKGYIALTPEEFAALTDGTATADPDDYATHQVNGENVTFDFVANGSNVSVTLDEVNHMYVITLNYERELHKLTVNYTFEGMTTPPAGFESVTTPTLGTPDGEGNYSDPGCYTSGQSYTVDPKTGSIPTGYELTKVIVNGEEKPVSFVGGNFGTGDGFEDITVQYVYTRIPGTHPDITDRITVNKYDDGEPQQLITSSSATFGLYSDENCENQVRPYATSGGKVTIEASASGLGAGTYYLKEINAPTGYTLSDQVWKLTVTVTPKEEWYNNTWVNYNVYDITATLAGEPVTSIDVTDKLLRGDYVVEYYFEQTPDGDDYVKGEDRDGNKYPDVPGKIGYFDTVKAEDHYLPDEDVPDGYHHGHDEPAFIEYDDENKTIKIYYDLDVPENTVEGDKIWHGEQTTAYVAVYQKLDGTLGAQPYQTPVKVGETSNHFSFSNLPQYVGGKVATYEVYEVISDGHSGWTKVESGSKIELNGKDYQVSYDGANVVNTELMDIPVTKTWIDGESAERPDSVTIALFQNGVKLKSANLTSAANWKYTFQDLPKYDEDGRLYTYKVYEMNGNQKVENNGTIGGYTVIYDGAYQNEITNKLTDITTGKTSAKVTKTWIAPWVDLPESITFKLYKTTGTTLDVNTAEFVQDVVLTKPATESLEWTATVDELKTRNDQGYPYTYFFEEQAVAGFTGRHNAAKTEFTNVIDQVNDVTVSGSKRWVDNGVARPTSVTIVLQSDEAQQGVFADVAGKTVEINEAGNWQFTFENLPRYVYTEDQGVVTGVREIVYKVTDSVPNYTTTGGTAADGYVLTNTFQQEYLDIPVTKAWIDGNNTDGNRPEEVAIALFRNGVKFQDATIAAADDWKYTFEDLPKYSDNQKTEYEYKVYEMDGGNQVENNGTAGGYTVTYAGDNQRNITNKLTDITTGKTSAKVTKTWIAPWVDLPESITFKLYKTTETTLDVNTAEFVQDVVLTKPAAESLEWTATVSDLPTRNAQGYRYTYFFEEQAVSGFELTDTNPAKTQFTNRIQQVSDVKVSVEKLWDGAIANSIPDSLFVQLYRDGVSMGDTYNVELKPDADGKWIHTFENLDRYDLTTGKYYSYTVQEGYFTDNEGVRTWNPVAESETITFNKDTGDYTFKVSYNTTGYETNKVQATITNTYDSCKLYQYRVDRVYNYYSDGELVPGASSMVTGDVTDGTKDQIITVTDEEANAFKKTDGKEEFTYVTGDPAVDDGTGKLVPTVTLTKVGELCVITLLYEFRYNTPSPDYHKVTVNYYDQDGNKIAESFVSDRIREGRSWDFSDKVRDTITVDGVTYVLDHADGDPITGTNIRRDQVVDLHYVVQEPDVDIPDEDTPQGGEPDDPGDPGDPGEPDEPDEPDGPDVEIPDPEVPEGDLPQTGTTADQMSVSAGGLLGVSAILAATGLVVVEFSRRKEQEDN